MTIRETTSRLVVLLCIIAPTMLSSTAQAQATPKEPAVQRKIKAVSADATQKRYERKAALAATDIGLDATQLELPVTYCRKAGDKTECSEIAKWRYTIDAKLEAAMAQELFDWIVTQRLDKILLNGDTATIQTGRTSKTVTVPHLAGFKFGEGTDVQFRDAAEDWLDKRAGRALGTVLEKGKVARYLELKDRERGTFMVDHAKAVGMPVEFVEKLMNSAFAFFVHVKRPDASVSISESTRTIIRKGKEIKVPVWNASVSIDASVVTLIYNYLPDTGRFALYSQLTGESGFGISTSKSYPTRPTSEDTIQLFQESMAVAMRAVGVNLNTQIKADDAFAIIFSADTVDGSDVGADVGIMEDIRVDAPATVTRTIDGLSVQVGLVKARDVSVNCDGRTPTRFELISGSSEQGDSVREVPWTGLMVETDFGVTGYTLTKFDSETAKGGGSFVGPTLGVDLDLGYATNTSALSEVWFDLGFGLGFGGEGFDQIDSASPLLVKLDVGFSKRIYLASSGVFLAPGAQFGFMAMSATGKPESASHGDDETHSASSITITPSMRLGYNVSSNFELVAEGGWALPMTASGSRAIGEEDPTDVDVEVDAGLRVGITLAFHLPVVGPMARLYSKPSSVCREPKDTEKTAAASAQ
jgi:hypothetical protein